MSEVNIYRLVGGIKNPGWEIRQNDVFVPRIVEQKSQKGTSTEKVDVGLRQIQYVKGAKSFWVEDNTNAQGRALDHTPLWIENGIMTVPKVDKVLNAFLQIHPEFGKKFELYDPEKEAKHELDAFELEEKVKERLRAMSKEELKALAIIKYGIGVTRSWKENKVKLELFKEAGANPKKLLQDYLEDKNVGDLLFTALSFELGIVKTTPDSRSVVWGETGHEIIKLGKGEKPIETLNDFLSSDDGLETKQSIGAKAEKLKKTTKK